MAYTNLVVPNYFELCADGRPIYFNYRSIWNAWRDDTMAEEIKVRFGAHTRYCESQQEAYIWLWEAILRKLPSDFLDKNEDICNGHRNRNYIAPTPKGLWTDDEDLSGEKRRYKRLYNGWYLNLCLNERDKLMVLTRLTKRADFVEGKDWDWKKW